MGGRDHSNGSSERPASADPSAAISSWEPLAPSQEALWLHQQRHPSSTAYNLTVGIRIGGPIRGEVVQAALQAVIDRHDPLRSVYKEVGGHGRRFVLASMPLRMGTVALDPPPSGDDWVGDPRVSAAIDGIAMAPYRLERESLRAALLTDGEERHLLLMGLHHLTADGWSARQFVVEGVANFQQLAAGEKPYAASPARTYGEWASAERARLTGDGAVSARTYWESTLADVPVESRLPFALPTPEPSLAGARMEVAIPARVRDRLRRLAREQQASTFTAILAGCQAILARLSSQDDVVVAVPHANRAEEVRETIGLFAGTLPIRSRLNADTTFRTLVDEVSVALRGARAHGWLPIDQIVKTAGVATGPEDSLSQVMVNYLGLAVPAIHLGDVEFEYLGTFDTGESQYELSVHLEEIPERMRGFVEYRTDRFAEADIGRLWRRLLAYLEAAAENPDEALCELPILDREDRLELRRLEHGPDDDWDLGTPLDAYVEQQARRTPNAIALSDARRRLSYSEMWSQVESLSARLRGHGVERGDVVLICAERSVQLPIALLAIMHAGAVYCPLDPEQPLARLRHVLTQARPVAAVADPAQQYLIADLAGDDQSIELIVLAADAGSPPRRAGERAERRSSAPEDPAYLIFTSGSTGKPKGVLVPHRGVVNRLLWMQKQFDLLPDDTILQKTPYTFDVSVWELFWPLMVGARLHLADPGGHRDPEYLAEVIRAEGVTTTHFVPTMLAAFMQGLAAPSCPSLRRVICSGEALPGNSMARALEVFPAATLWNLYGPTEASIDVTCWRCRQQGPGDAVPIGRPISNVACFVLDTKMKRVPIGTPGELYVGGVQIALGYAGQPELTGERFVESELAPGRLYRTGDLVRWRADGLLDYLGRADRQVKVRGVRIELGEIEEVLRGLDEVADATVIVRDDVGPSEALVAYVVPAGQACDEVELRVRLARLLPDYMVPLRVVPLERLPSTSSGKVDQHALPRPAARPARGGRGLSSQERLLAELWSKALSIGNPASIGPVDSYFALGGDSMTSVKLRAEARQAGFELALKDILSRPLLADMAMALRAEAVDSDAAPASLARPESLPAGIDDAYPLAAMQAGMIFHSEFSETSSTYQVTFDLELRMPWAPDSFQAAVDDLVERHEILRTSFDLHSFGEPMQLVHRRSELPVRVVDVRALSTEERQLECDRIFDAEQVRPFDLGKPTALRLSLVRTGEEVAHLFMAFHDSIFDGWSGAVFLTELYGRYLARLEGRELSGGRLGTRYRDFVALEKAVLADEGLEHWLRLCEGAPFARLPRREHVVGTGRSRDVGLDVPAAVIERLRSVAAAQAVPLKALLVGAYLAAVGRASGERDVLVGLVTGGRPETADSDRTLGQFLNTVPVRARLDGSWSSLISQVHARELEGIPFRRVPLLELMKRRGRAPFETAFNLVHFHVYSELADNPAVDLLSGRFTDPFHFPLTVNARMHPLDGSLAIVANYNESEVDVDQAKRLAGDVVSALAAIADDPSASCEDWLGDRVPSPVPARRGRSPAPGIVSPGRAREGGPLDTAIVTEMSELWRSVLGVDRAELDQDFFAEGGDSILTVQLAARARALGLALRPRDVFECGTLRGLIRRVEVGADGLDALGERIATAPIYDPGLIALAASHQGGYECSVACFELLVELDRAALAAATGAVLRRHQLLRSLATEEGPGEWTRRVVEVDPERLPLVWSRDRGVADWLGELMEKADARRGPSALVGYLGNGRGSAFLALVGDHGSVDLASLQLAGGDLLDAYAQHTATGAISLDQAPGLAELEQVRLRHYDSGPSYRSTPLPWRPAAASLGGEARAESIELDEATTGEMQEAARRVGAGIQHLLLIAVARALREGSDLDLRRPVVLDLMDIGRSPVGIEADLVAPLAHPVPLAVPGHGSVLDLAAGIARDLTGPGRARSRVRELVDIAVEDEPLAEAPGALVNHLGRTGTEVPWPLKRVVAPDIPLRGAPRRAGYALEVRSQTTGAGLSVELSSPRDATGADRLAAFSETVRLALAEVAGEAAGAEPRATGRQALGGVS